MGIRIQPQQFQVRDNDPFANDTLGRRQPAKCSPTSSAL